MIDYISVITSQLLIPVTPQHFGGRVRLLRKNLNTVGWLFAYFIFYFMMTTEDATWINMITFSVNNIPANMPLWGHCRQPTGALLPTWIGQPTLGPVGLTVGTLWHIAPVSLWSCSVGNGQQNRNKISLVLLCTCSTDLLQLNPQHYY